MSPMGLLCFGDSNTWGYDPRDFFGGRYDEADLWTNRLTGYTVINAGLNGREIPHTAITPPEHDIFLVMLGTNDLLQGASATQTADRMERFLSSMLPRCRQILLVSPPPLKRGAWVPSGELVEDSIALAKEYRRIAEKLGVCFIDTTDWNIGLAFDGVHFTEKGHHLFAKNLQKRLDSPLT